MKCLIVEDETLAAEALAELLEEECAGNLTIAGVAKNATEANKLVHEHDPGVIFVDIRLPGLSGIEFVEQLTGNPMVVFTTAHDDYAIAAFELGAADYILKPYERERLRLTLSRILDDYRPARVPAVSRRLKEIADAGDSLQWIYIRGQGGISPVAIGSIMRIQAMDGYACLITDEHREHIIDMSLNLLERRLCHLNFMRISRACIVNVAHVSKFRSHPDRRLRVSFSDGAVMIASREFSKRFRQKTRTTDRRMMLPRTARMP